jgi:hypothetical protein
MGKRRGKVKKMVEKILVIRSGRDNIFEELYKRIKGKDVTVIIQRSKKEEYEKKYKDLKYIEIEDGMYIYKKGDEKKIKEKYDRVYLLSTRQLFNEMKEFYKLIKKAKLTKKLYGFNIFFDEIDLRGKSYFIFSNKIVFNLFVLFSKNFRKECKL